LDGSVSFSACCGFIGEIALALQMCRPDFLVPARFCIFLIASISTTFLKCNDEQMTRSLSAFR
jgi:hypothetical protein